MQGGHLLFCFHLSLPFVGFTQHKAEDAETQRGTRALDAALGSPFTVHWDMPCGARHSFAGIKICKTCAQKLKKN